MSGHDTRIPFGLKNGRVVDVSEVESGLACGASLQARKGKINQHHFSHDPSADMKACHGAVETAIHRMAKQIIEENKAFLIPELRISESTIDVNGFTQKEEFTVQSQALQRFDRVIPECYLSDIRPDIRPDILGEIDGKQIIIEIAVTSFVRPSKQNKMKNHGLAAIEVEIKNLSLTKEALRTLLLESPANKKWLFHPEEEPTRLRLKKALSLRIKKQIQL